MKQHKSWMVVCGYLLVLTMVCSCAPQALPTRGPAQEQGPRLRGTVTHSPPTPVSQYEAKDAIQTYARQVLGLNLEVTIGGGLAGEVTLPVTTQEGVDAAVDLAGTTYLGLWQDGLASLSLGDGTISGDLTGDIQDASLGIFVIRHDRPLPANSATALELIRTTYPGLAGLQFKEQPAERGFAFAAIENQQNLRLGQGQITLKGAIVLVGVVAGKQPGKTLAWTVIASGELATPFK